MARLRVQVAAGLTKGVAFCRDGMTNTFEAADVLGVAAMRNGTWIPAVANSLIHLNFNVRTNGTGIPRIQVVVGCLVQPAA